VSEATKTAESKYPDIASKLQSLKGEANVAQLWQQGHAWLHNPKKDFAVGRTIFGEIVKSKPNDYWALLLMGGCFTWDQRLTEGERFIRTALGECTFVLSSLVLTRSSLLSQQAILISQTPIRCSLRTCCCKVWFDLRMV